jgi:zona occludens toxin (predicted ATPase)
MVRDVVYTETGDARRRLFHRRALENLAAAQASAAVLAHHALAAGLAPAAFHYSLAAGREALHLAAPGEAIVHFEQARQLAQTLAPPEAAAEAEVQELYQLLGQAYALSGQPEQAKRLFLER